MKKSKKPLVIFVAGGSASGKTTVVNKILKRAGLEDVNIIKHDDYYLDQSNMTLAERRKVNYDHPKSLDNKLLYQHLKQLVEGFSIEKPVYDFVTFTRKENSETIYPKKVIMVEGILLLVDKQLRELSDLNIYVELDDDTRFIRRMLRDMQERKRSLESIVTQYQQSVKPMFHQYVKPSKRYADVIIPNDTRHDHAVDLIVSKIKEELR